MGQDSADGMVPRMPSACGGKSRSRDRDKVQYNGVRDVPLLARAENAPARVAGNWLENSLRMPTILMRSTDRALVAVLKAAVRLQCTVLGTQTESASPFKVAEAELCRRVPVAFPGAWCLHPSWLPRQARIDWLDRRCPSRERSSAVEMPAAWLISVARL